MKNVEGVEPKPNRPHRGGAPISEYSNIHN